MNQKGFTLIELVVVIVVLGILAAVAVPKYVDLTGEADQAAVEAVAGGLASASAINFAMFKANPDSTEVTAVKNCTNTASLMDGWDGSKYSVNSSSNKSGNTLTNCYVFTPTDSEKYSATFTAFYVSN